MRLSPFRRMKILFLLKTSCMALLYCFDIYNSAKCFYIPTPFTSLEDTRYRGDALSYNQVMFSGYP